MGDQVGDSIQAKIEDGLERSRVLVLFMSASAFGSDWVGGEHDDVFTGERLDVMSVRSWREKDLRR